MDNVAIAGIIALFLIVAMGIISEINAAIFLMGLLVLLKMPFNPFSNPY
ncbi:MAG: hypothetical protein ABH803_04130 [Candidatus Micrarchaeota archaeon]